MKKFIVTTLSSAVLLATVSPAAAQDYRFTEAFAPQEDEISATFNYKVPLGAKAEKPSYGLSLNASRADDARFSDDGRTFRPTTEIADFRFNEDGLAAAKVGSLNLASKAEQDRLGFADGEKSTVTWVIIGLVVVGAIVWAVSDDDDDDDNDN